VDLVRTSGKKETDFRPLC